MKLNLCDKLDRQRFQRRCAILLERGSFVELREIAPKSRNQNNYLHLLLTHLCKCARKLDSAKHKHRLKHYVRNCSIFIGSVLDGFIICICTLWFTLLRCYRK